LACPVALFMNPHVPLPFAESTAWDFPSKPNAEHP
jgi:hypothetical protein